jgi:hypothetical protein
MYRRARDSCAHRGSDARPDRTRQDHLFWRWTPVAVAIAFVNFKAPEGVNATEAWRRRIVVAVLAAGAFTIYAAATPTFFYENKLLTIAFTQWAAVAAVVAAVILPPIAGVFGVFRARD